MIGSLLAVLGVTHTLAGLVALDNRSFYEVSSQGAVHHDIAGWGWTELLLGGLLLAVAVGVVAHGGAWVRPVGLALAGLGALTSFFLLAYDPLWSALNLVLAAVLMWWLIAGRTRTRRTRHPRREGRAATPD